MRALGAGSSGRLITGALVLGILSLPVSSIAAPQRTVVDTGRSYGFPRAQAWIERDDAEMRHGADFGWTELEFTPETIQPFDPQPLVRPLVPQAPEQADLPAVEDPDSAPGPHLPDLAPMPAWGVYVDSTTGGVTLAEHVQATAERRDPYAGSRRALRFGTTVSNVGRYALDVTAEPGPDAAATAPEGQAPVQQCVYFTGHRVAGTARRCQRAVRAEAASIDAAQGRLVMEEFLRYRLLRDRGGRPDTGAGGAVAHGGRSDVCLSDDHILREDPPGMDHGWYRECRVTRTYYPGGLRQGVSPGWGYYIPSETAGQHLLLEGVPDGVYWVEIAVNLPAPGRVQPLRESTVANNVSYQRIRLTAEEVVEF